MGKTWQKVGIVHFNVLPLNSASRNEHKSRDTWFEDEIHV